MHMQQPWLLWKSKLVLVLENETVSVHLDWLSSVASSSHLHAVHGLNLACPSVAPESGCPEHPTGRHCVPLS